MKHPVRRRQLRYTQQAIGLRPAGSEFTRKARRQIKLACRKLRDPFLEQELHRILIAEANRVLEGAEIRPGDQSYADDREAVFNYLANQLEKEVARHAA